MYMKNNSRFGWRVKSVQMMNQVDLRERVHGSPKRAGYDRTKQNRNWKKEVYV